MVRVAYCKKKKVADMPGMEIDIQTFFNVMLDIYMAIAEKKLLRSVILLSFVSIFVSHSLVRWAKEVWGDRPDSLVRVERLQPAWLESRHVQGRIQQDQEAHPKDIPGDRAGLERESQWIARAIRKWISFNSDSCPLLGLRAYWTSFTIRMTRTTMRAKSDCIICLISI